LRIQLIKDFPCEDCYQQRQRKGHYIRESKAINKYADAKDNMEKNMECLEECKKENSQNGPKTRK
jgi:hypothetical protein